MEEGDIASFFVKDLLIGLALAPKMCPDQSQAFKAVNSSQAFTVGRTSRRCSKACLYKVSHHFLRIGVSFDIMVAASG